MTLTSISRRAILGGGASLALASGLPAFATSVKSAHPLVFAHRGASALRPEHTLAAYARAIADGADFVELDLVSTSDGVLISRHDNELSGTTDVAARPEFAGRKTTKVINGHAYSGWFSEDFTLAEIRQLRARERYPDLRTEGAAYNGQFPLVTLEDAADFLAAQQVRHGRVIGLIPELKFSTYFAGLGLALEPRFLEALRNIRVLREVPIIVQSFEVGNLKTLQGQLSGLPNVQLMQLTGMAHEAPYDTIIAGQARTYAEMLTPAGLKDMARYADWVAPHKTSLIAAMPDGRLGSSSGIARAARDAGLLVGTWNFRPENEALPAEFRHEVSGLVRNAEGSIHEIRRYLAEGLDGFFTDDPALGRAALLN